MEAFKFDGPSDGDEEMEEMAKLKTEWEQDIKYSKNGIIAHIVQNIEQEQPSHDKLWDQKL